MVVIISLVMVILEDFLFCYVAWSKDLQDKLTHKPPLGWWKCPQGQGGKKDKTEND